jgi:hypothetical protein
MRVVCTVRWNVFFQHKSNIVFFDIFNCCIAAKTLVRYRMFKACGIYSSFNTKTFKFVSFCGIKVMKYFVSNGVTGKIITVLMGTFVTCYNWHHWLLNFIVWRVCRFYLNLRESGLVKHPTFRMPRIHVRRTDFGISQEVMEAAATEVISNNNQLEASLKSTEFDLSFHRFCVKLSKNENPQNGLQTI